MAARVLNFHRRELPQLEELWRLADWEDAHWELPEKRHDHLTLLDLPPAEEAILKIEARRFRHPGRTERIVRSGPRRGVYQFSPWTAENMAMLGALEKVLGPCGGMQGDFYYPRGGYRGWHTNSYDAQGWRMYLVRTIGVGSWFQYWDGDKIKVVPDDDYTINFFRVARDEPLFHGVVANGAQRWSKGFVVPAGWQARLLEEAK